MTKAATIIVIGGGASGITAAIAAARQDSAARVIIAERADRIGKKILATGNGRCNLSNVNIAPDFYHSADLDVLRRILELADANAVRGFFASLGLLLEEKEEGRLYPFCNQASMVLNVLLAELDRLGVTVKCDFTVSRLQKTTDGYLVFNKNGDCLAADRLIVATGGKAAPAFGCDGLGLRLLQDLGHQVTTLHPSLVPVKTDNTYFKALKGLRASCEVAYWLDGSPVKKERGEVLFTDYGLSGIAVMQLSRYMDFSRQNIRRSLVLDLLPNMAEKELKVYLIDRKKALSAEPIEHILLGSVGKKIGQAVLKYLGFTPLSRAAADFSDEQIGLLAQTLKAWEFAVNGTLSWDNAQVTSGGVRLTEVDAASLRSIKCSSLYICGEALDVDGACGGYNLHWAWLSGLIAGRSAALNQ